jgi:hypothetical protein
MADFEMGTVSCSAEVKLAFEQSGINQETLLQKHGEAEVDDSGWATSSFSFPELGGKTVWAITDIKKQSTLLLFEGR